MPLISLLFHYFSVDEGLHPVDAGASLTHQASQCMERRTAGQCQHIYFRIALEAIAPTFYEGIQKEAHLYCIVDRKAFISFNAVR
jgi:hypothetical protein